VDNETPFYPNKDGKLTAGRWHFLNTMLSQTDLLDDDKIITGFCMTWGIPRWHVEAELATYRHQPPGPQ